jgi:hypothetical protein
LNARGFKQLHDIRFGAYVRLHRDGGASFISYSAHNFICAGAPMDVVHANGKTFPRRKQSRGRANATATTGDD